MPGIFLEMGILAVSLCIFPVQLNSTFKHYYRNIHPEPSFVYFGLNLVLSLLWVILASITGQYFILVTVCNGLMCQTCILTMMYLMKKRDELLVHSITPPASNGPTQFQLPMHMANAKNNNRFQACDDKHGMCNFVPLRTGPANFA